MIPTNRQIHAKLEIVRPSGRVDVTPYLEAAEVELGSIEDLGTGTGADIGVRTLTFTLRNDGQMVRYWGTEDVLGDSEDILGDSGGVANLGAILGEGKLARNSFAPRDRTSAWNLVNGQWVPLLWPYREVILEVSATAPGEAPNWVTLFEGYMGDDISTEGHSITVTCRDKPKRLMDAYIDVAKTYEGPMSPEDLIQAIINDYVESPPTLYCPIPSGMTFEKMTVEYASVWDAIQNVATQTGWFLGYRWNGQAFVLTFLEPPRGRNTPDFEFHWEDDIYHETLNVSDKDIRNALTISFRDSTTGERRTLSYQDYPELRNDASKEEYGGLYRIMQIEEADTSLIDTEEKALAFGEKCIWDLSELSATDRLDLPLLPELDLFSTFTVENPLTSSTKDFYAVQSIRHTLSFGESGRFRTEVIATGRVVGAKTKWQDMETRPGRPGDPNQKGKDGSGVTMAFKRSETKPDTPMPSGGMPPGWYADVESTTGSGPLWATVGTRADSKSFWIWQEPVKMEGEDGEDFVPPKPATPVWAGYTLTNVLTVNWHIAEHASDYEIRENLNWGNAVGLVFRGYAHSLSFIPKSREFILYLRALNAIGEYSEGYDTIHVSLPAPEPPQQPAVEAYFNALKIHPTPLDNPAVVGYFVYVTGDGIDDKLAIIAGGSLTYPLPSGTTVTIQVSAYDILGEGGKSQPLQATTTALDPLDLPEIPKSKLEESLREDIDLTKTSAIDALAQISDLDGVIDGALAEIDNTKQRVSDAETDLLDAKNRLSGVEDEVDSAKDRLLGAESRLFSIDNEIADAKDRLTGAESKLTATETNLTDARNRLASVEGSITDAEARLVDAENRLSSVDSEIDGVKTRLTDAESDLEGLEGVVSTHETKISNVEGELSTKVSKTEFNALAGTVSTHGTTLAQHAGMIAMKAEQSEVDTLSEAVSSNTATLTVHATQIAARVTKEVYNLLENRVEEAEGELVALADEISAKVSQTVFEDLQNRVTANEAELLVQAEAIQARVTQEVYDTLANRVTTVEGTLEVLPEQIALKASQLEVDALTNRVEDNEAELLVLATEISSKVSQTVFDALSDTVASQGTQITQNATAIESKADQSEVDTLSGTVSDHSTLISQTAEAIETKADKSVVDTLSGTVSSHTSTLQQHANMIAARVTTEVFNALEDRVEANEAELIVLVDEISSKVSQSVFDVLEQRVTTNEGTLTVHADMIATRVTQEVFDALEGRVTNAEGELTVLADEVSAKVSQTVFDTLAGRVETAEGILEVLPGQINAKADQSVVDTLTERVEEAEGQLSVLATEIAARVTQEVFDALEGRVETAEGELSVLADEISMKVSQTVFDELEGLVSHQGAQIALNTESITGVVSRVQSVEGQVTERASQIQLLGDEITLKVQRTVNGEMVVTGIGMGFDETGQSIIPVLADRFVVKSGVNDEGQYAFLVDSQTGKVYIPGNLTVGGLLRARELQVDLIKSLLIQGEVAYLDEANVLHLRADKITVGGSASPSSGIPLPKPSGSHVWHYDKHLSSTDGIGPTSATGAVVVGGKGVAGGALRLSQGGSVVYELNNPVTSFTWAEFYEEG